MEKLYKGINAYFTSNKAGAKHYFVINRGADYTDIVMRLAGADSISHSPGTYSIHTGIGSLKYDTLVAYEIDASGAVIPNTMQPLDIYKDTVNGHWHFVPFTYNTSSTLVIMAKKKEQQAAVEPEHFNIGWSTYFGGNTEDELIDITVDSEGSQYIGGNTTTQFFPPSVGPFTSYGTNFGNIDALALKFDKDEALNWITYYGGTKDDELTALAVTKNSTPAVAYAVGHTYSTNIPIFSNSTEYYDDYNDGDNLDMMIFKLDNAGYLEWSTFYGNAGGDVANDVAIDNQNNVYVVGQASYTADLEFQNGATNNTHLPFPDHIISAFILKFNEVNEIKWASFIHQPTCFTKGANAVTCDTLNNVYTTGYTYDTNTDNGDNVDRVPTLPPGYNSDIWVVMFNPANAYEWGKNWGDAYTDVFNDVAVDNQNNLYLAGYSTSPTMQGHNADSTSTDDFYDLFNQHQDVYLVKFAANSGAVKWATYYGGEWDEQATHLALDSAGNLYVSGISGSSDIDFPLASPPNYYLKSSHNDNDNSTKDGFILKFNPHCDLEWTTYFGQNTNNDSGEFCDDVINSICYVGSKLFYCGTTTGRGEKSSDLVIPLHKYDWTSSSDYWQPNSNSEFNYEGFVGFFDSLQTANTIGIKKLNLENDLIVYPNPTKDILNVRFVNKNNEKCNLSIFNAQGLLVLNSQVPVKNGINKINISTQSLSTGLYFIKLHKNNEIYYQKFIKN